MNYLLSTFFTPHFTFFTLQSIFHTLKWLLFPRSTLPTVLHSLPIRFICLEIYLHPSKPSFCKKLSTGLDWNFGKPLFGFYYWLLQSYPRCKVRTQYIILYHCCIRAIYVCPCVRCFLGLSVTRAQTSKKKVLQYPRNST